MEFLLKVFIFKNRDNPNNVICNSLKYVETRNVDQYKEACDGMAGHVLDIFSTLLCGADLPELATHTTSLIISLDWQSGFFFFLKQAPIPPPPFLFNPGCPKSSPIY